MGHTTTVTLMKARGADTSAMAGVLENSVQWGNFMGVSSNLRYQLVNGWEARLLPLIKVGTGVIPHLCARWGGSKREFSAWLKARIDVRATLFGRKTCVCAHTHSRSLVVGGPCSQSASLR